MVGGLNLDSTEASCPKPQLVGLQALRARTEKKDTFETGDAKRRASAAANGERGVGARFLFNILFHTVSNRHTWKTRTKK